MISGVLKNYQWPEMGLGKGCYLRLCLSSEDTADQHPIQTQSNFPFFRKETRTFFHSVFSESCQKYKMIILRKSSAPNPLNIFESKYIPVMIKSFISSQDLSLTLMLPQEVLLGDLSINAFVGHMLSCYTLIEKCFILMKTNVYCTKNEVFHYGLLQ